MWLEPDEEILLGSKEGCAPLSPSEPNVLQIGNNWKLGQMYDKNHFSVSAKQDAGLSNNAAKTAIIHRHDGKAFSGPRSDYNAWGEVPTYSNSPPRCPVSRPSLSFLCIRNDCIPVAHPILTGHNLSKRLNVVYLPAVVRVITKGLLKRFQ